MEMGRERGGSDFDGIFTTVFFFPSLLYIHLGYCSFIFSYLLHFGKLFGAVVLGVSVSAVSWPDGYDGDERGVSYLFFVSVRGFSFVLGAYHSVSAFDMRYESWGEMTNFLCMAIC